MELEILLELEEKEWNNHYHTVNGVAFQSMKEMKLALSSSFFFFPFLSISLFRTITIFFPEHLKKFVFTSIYKIKLVRANSGCASAI